MAFKLATKIEPTLLIVIVLQLLCLVLICLISYFGILNYNDLNFLAKKEDTESAYYSFNPPDAEMRGNDIERAPNQLLSPRLLTIINKMNSDNFAS